jgi:hypothetical protein
MFPRRQASAPSAVRSPWSRQAFAIGANQASNSSFTIATEVTRDVTITPILPGAPVIGTGTPGNNQAVIAFTAPGNTGGTAITGFAASCTPSGSGTGTVSPIVVSGLTNGVTYTCSVRATNSVGTGPVSGSVMSRPPTPTAPTITSATSTSFTVNARALSPPPPVARLPSLPGRDRDCRQA